MSRPSRFVSAVAGVTISIVSGGVITLIAAAVVVAATPIVRSDEGGRGPAG